MVDLNRITPALKNGEKCVHLELPEFLVLHLSKRGTPMVTDKVCINLTTDILPLRCLIFSRCKYSKDRFLRSLGIYF